MQKGQVESNTPAETSSLPSAHPNESEQIVEIPSDHCRACRSTTSLCSTMQVATGESMALGECNCGAVAFEIRAELSQNFICHCSICRRCTGSNGIAVVLIENDAFRWMRGEEKIATWRKPDADWQTWFCQDCGSPVPGANDESRMFVPAGLIFEGGEKLKVAHHVWVDSKAAWDAIGDAGRQHAEAFEG